MNIEKTFIEDLIVITPRVFLDNRGYFTETYHEIKYSRILPIKTKMVQDNLSYSKFGTIRGLHFQLEPYAQAKLVRCVLGEVLDVAVDIRMKSKTYGRHFSVVLSSENHKQLYLPRGFAHGFSVLSPEAIVEYKCDEFYNPEWDSGIIYNDKNLNIDWKIPKGKTIISSKDLELPSLDSIH